MNKTIMQLREKRDNVWNQTKTFLDEHRDPNTGLVPAPAVQQYNCLVSQIHGLGEEITRLEEQDEIERQLYGDDAAPVRSADNAPARDLSPVDSGAYGIAFQNMIRGQGNFRDVKDALSVGVDADGGYTVPDTFEKKLIKGLNDHNVIRRMAKVIRTKSGMHQIPILSGLPSVDWIDECAPVPETSMTFDRITLGAHKLGALLKASDEFLRDTDMDVEAYISEAFGTAVGKKEEYAFINGTGIKQPTGLLHDTDGASAGVTTENADAVTFDDVISLYYSLDTAYRQNAAFLCNEDLMMKLMMLKDGNGNYIWKPSMEVGKPDTLLGRPIYTSTAMPELCAGNKVALFGDFSYFWIADRGRSTLRRLDELFAVNEHTGFLLTQREDAKLILKDAMKVMKMKA